MVVCKLKERDLCSFFFLPHRKSIYKIFLWALFIYFGSAWVVRCPLFCVTPGPIGGVGSIKISGAGIHISIAWTCSVSCLSRVLLQQPQADFTCICQTGSTEHDNDYFLKRSCYKSSFVGSCVVTVLEWALGTCPLLLLQMCILCNCLTTRGQGSCKTPADHYQDFW